MSIACGPASDTNSSDTDRQAGAFTGGLIASDPAPPAPASVVDPMDPWSSLGFLSGGYSLYVERLEDDCSFGPDVPLTLHEVDPITGEFTRARETFAKYQIFVSHRGDSLAFELGEGTVFATWNENVGRLSDVERVGAEGITFYSDGFDVSAGATGSGEIVISGESRWQFSDEYYSPGEVCTGRTRWYAWRLLGAPDSAWNDLQVVLRWPAHSSAELDLTVQPARDQYTDEEDSEIDFVTARSRCYSLHSSGPAALQPSSVSNPYEDLVATLSQTKLPYHEEVIRCQSAAWGWWSYQVTNFSSTETVDYELEVFWGPHVNTTRQGERSFGAQPWTMGPQSRDHHAFKLIPPLQPGDTAGSTQVIFTGYYDLEPADRPLGPVSGTHLEFNKAAFYALSYQEFIAALGF